MKQSGEIFDALIRPLSRDEFFEKYFEQKPCLAGNVDLPLNLGLEAFERLLWSHEKELQDRIQLNRSGQDIFYARNRDGMDIYGWVMKHFADGYTVIFNGLETVDPEAAKIALELNHLFNGPTSLNVFLTPPGSRGFLPHFDTHDVFVCQMEGSKVWNLYEEEVTLPRDQQMYLIDQQSLGETIARYELKPGDVLYIPRGVIHGANTSSKHALHVTIGIRPQLRVDYLKSMLDTLSEYEPAFRKSHALAGDEEYAALVDKLRAAVEDPYSIKKTADAVRADRTSRGRPVPGHRLRNSLLMGKLNLHAVVCKAFPGKAVIANHEDKVRIYFPGLGFSGEGDMLPGHITLDAIAYGALNFINKQTGSFRIADMPDFYDDDTKLLIAKELVSAGFLTIIEIS